MTDNPNRERFQAAYQTKPPWDLGRPQQPYVDIADQVTGSVLDVGCGTGDNALYFARRGQPVLGIDFVPSALIEARRKAQAMGVDAEFVELDVLQLNRLGRRFDSVIDCGLFHVLSDDDRRDYVTGLGLVTKPEARVFLMCFSDQEPGETGPRRISQADLRDAFADGWTVESITAARFAPNPDSQQEFANGGPQAWFAVIRRTGGVR